LQSTEIYPDIQVSKGEGEDESEGRGESEGEGDGGDGSLNGAIWLAKVLSSMATESNPYLSASASALLPVPGAGQKTLIEAVKQTVCALQKSDTDTNTTDAVRFIESMLLALDAETYLAVMKSQIANVCGKQHGRRDRPGSSTVAVEQTRSGNMMCTERERADRAGTNLQEEEAKENETERDEGTLLANILQSAVRDMEDPQQIEKLVCKIYSTNV
jgi:hypothetical protein